MFSFSLIRYKELVLRLLNLEETKDLKNKLHRYNY